MVYAPGPLDDGKYDFLVNDIEDETYEPVPDTVYLSDGTVAPVARVAMGGAGAAGFLGVGTILALCLVLGLVGVGVLWAYSPALDTAGLDQVVAGHRNAVAACRSGEKGDVLVRVSASNGKVSAKAVGGSAKESVRRCVAEVMSDGAWPAGSWSVTVPVELQ